MLLCKGHVIEPSPVNVGKVLLALTDQQKFGATYKSDPALGPGDTVMNKETRAKSLRGLRILAFASLAEYLLQVS